MSLRVKNNKEPQKENLLNETCTTNFTRLILEELFDGKPDSKVETVLSRSLYLFLEARQVYDLVKLWIRRWKSKCAVTQPAPHHGV